MKNDKMLVKQNSDSKMLAWKKVVDKTRASNGKRPLSISNINDSDDYKVIISPTCPYMAHIIWYVNSYSLLAQGFSSSKILKPWQRIIKVISLKCSNKKSANKTMSALPDR